MKFDSRDLVQPWVPRVMWARSTVYRKWKRKQFYSLYFSVVAKKPAEKYLLGTGKLGFLCAVNSPLFLDSFFCSLAPFSGWILLHIDLWGPHWPLEVMSIVGISPIDEKFPQLAAFFCLAQPSGTKGCKGNWQCNLSTFHLETIPCLWAP